MKLVFIFLTIISNQALANISIPEIFQKTLVDNYYFEEKDAHKKVLSYRDETKLDVTEEHFQLIYNQYFISTPKDFNFTSQENLQQLKSIIAYCLYHSHASTVILDTCSSDDLIEKIDYFTESLLPHLDSGPWPDFMSDLYEISYLLQDNRDDLLKKMKSISNSDRNDEKEFDKTLPNETKHLSGSKID